MKFGARLDARTRVYLITCEFVINLICNFRCWRDTYPMPLIIQVFIRTILRLNKLQLEWVDRLSS